MKHKPLGVIIRGKSFKNEEEKRKRKRKRRKKKKKKGLFDAEEETDGPVL
jgi:hypothetical protein